MDDVGVVALTVGPAVAAGTPSPTSCGGHHAGAEHAAAGPADAEPGVTVAVSGAWLRRAPADRRRRLADEVRRAARLAARQLLASVRVGRGGSGRALKSGRARVPGVAEHRCATVVVGALGARRTA